LTTYFKKEYANSMEAIKKEWSAKVALLLFIFFTAWWGYMTFFLPKDSAFYGYFGNVYGVIALWGAIWGILISRHWGGLKSILGRAIFMLSIGLLLQEFGQLAYSYYIFVLHIEIPYPSIGDIGFFGTIPFYIYGAYLLGKASGVKISLKSFESKLQAVLIPLTMLAVAYFLILKGYNFDLKQPLETLLNFGYPTGQAIYISIAILTFLLTKSILGGVMKRKIIFIIAAFIAQFLADYAFVYFKNSYYPGSILDYLYVLAYFLMALGLIQFKTVFDKTRSTD
jgi:hypothetical protein